MTEHIGALVWEGRSRFDGADIGVVATGLTRPSRNMKTGMMAQVWVLRADGELRSVGMTATCGACAAKPWCYVDRSKLAAIVRAWRGGRYRPGLDAVARSRWPLRLGAFGNMSAAPWPVTESLIEASGDRGWTCYEHDWESCDPRFAGVAMASCERPDQALKAVSMGWRFFLVELLERVEATIGRLRAHGVRAVECPHSATSGRVQCSACGLCDGVRSASDHRPSIVNPVHGARAGNYRRWRSLPVLQDRLTQ